MHHENDAHIDFFDALFTKLHSWSYPRIATDALVRHGIAWRPITGLTFSSQFLRALEREYNVTGEIALERWTLPCPTCGALSDSESKGGIISGKPKKKALY